MFLSTIRSLSLVLLLSGLLPLTAAGGQLQVTGRKLGWDNRLRPNQFNQIVITVTNIGTSVWEGEVSLGDTLSQDFPQVESELFIEPGGSRNIRFVVFYRSGMELELAWRSKSEYVRQLLRNEQEFELPSTLDPAIVQLLPEQGTQRGASVPRLEAEFFPTSAAGISGLKGVLLESVPDFQPAQQQAFLDWIYQGGELHIFRQSADSPLQFSGMLAELNQPLPEFTVGAGRVVRHTGSLAEADRAFIDQQFRLNSSGAANEENTYWYSPLASILSPLQQLTRPQHNWSLIFLLAVLYLLTLFPGCYLLGRFQSDYRLTYLGLAGVVGLFSLAFDRVGRRGYGESTSCNFIAIARPVSNDRLLVTQVSNLFVTAGGRYQIEHQAADCVYAAAGSSDFRLAGGVTRGDRALNRPLSAVSLDIPAFSDRRLVHAGVVPGSISPIAVDEISWTGNTLERIVLRPANPANWPGNQITQRRLLVGSRLYLLANDGERLIAQGSGETLDMFFNTQAGQGMGWDDGVRESGELFRRAFAAAIPFQLGVENGRDLSRELLPPDRGRLYLMVPATAEYGLRGDLQPQLNGTVIYVVDFELSAP